MDAEKEHANKALFMFFASFLERLYFFQMFLLVFNITEASNP